MVFNIIKKIFPYHLFQKLLSFLILYFYSYSGFSQFSFDSIFQANPVLSKITKESKKYRLQIIYTQIQRDKDGNASFKDYDYRLDSDYFYCASLVKLPISVLALEKLNQLHIPKESIMMTDSANACQHSYHTDTSSENHLPSIEHYIKKMCLVSDNYAYGRVYEFDGVDYIHERLQSLGYSNIRIVNRFDGGCQNLEHVTTNPIRFFDKNMNLIYNQAQQIAKLPFSHPMGIVQVGHAYMNSKNKKINQPKDFSRMNYIPLSNIHDLLKRLIFNEQLPKEKQLKLSIHDQQFLIQYLSMLPRESIYPKYNPKTYYDSYKKYFIYGDSKNPITDTNLVITNIVGQSYGFMTDCAYIQDKKHHVEFLLSATIYTNENEIINDGKYEYNTIALPFLAELGRQILNYEKRSK